MNRRVGARLDVLRPDLRKKVAKPTKLEARALKRLLTVGDPAIVQDYRKRKTFLLEASH